MNRESSKPDKSVARRGIPSTQIALKLKPQALMIALSLLLLPATKPASAAGNREVEHPGVVHTDDNCSSCHADKIRGRSVHSAIVLKCTVCHLARTQGDMTTLTLLMPKAKICFACHAEDSSVRQHRTATKGLCLKCHDAHSSSRRMLLLKPAFARRN